MPETTPRSALPPESRGPHVRLITLVNLRWLALLGQAVTVVLAYLWLKIDLDLLLCAAAIGAGAAANMVLSHGRAVSERVGERAAFGFLLFDVLQLSAILFLTGGLNNPFAVLVIAPVAIAATVLSLRATVLLAATAIAMISLLGGYHLPLRSLDGDVLELPDLQRAGFFVAILVGTLFLSGFAFRLTRETEQLSEALLATQTALAREQKLHDLGGVVAAAAHELNTPLATIKLVSAELADELEDRPELHEDITLIRSQADRCRDILRDMGRAGKTDTHMETAPFETVIREAAAPHDARGIDVVYDLDLGAEAGEPPQIRRSPEIIHGLRNLIQNAVDFAEATVWIELRWSAQSLSVRVIDDGRGYPPEVLPHLGDPFLRSRSRPGYEGMGLGLFIAKTLLERTGARVAFDNAPPGPSGRRGARAHVIWPRSAIVAEGRARLGANMPILP